MRFLALLTLVLASVVAWSAPTVSVRVDGPGYLRFTRDGRTLYAKAADLTVVEGRLGEKGGAKTVPALEIAAGVRRIDVALDGTVTTDGRTVGRLVLAVFSAVPTAEDGLFSSAVRPTLADPGEGDTGVVRSGNGPKVAPIASPGPVPTVKPDIMAGAARTTSPNKPVKNADGRILILLRDKSEVEAKTFTLGEIAEIHADPALAGRLGSSEIGETPPIGVERIVDRNRILSRVKSFGIDPTTVDLGGPEKARVVRKGQQVTHEQFVEAAVRGSELKGLAGMESGAPGPVMTVPMGDLELVCESVGAGTAETMVTVGVYVDGRRFNCRTVKLKSNAPATRLKVGSIVPVHVTHGRLTVETKGKVTKVDLAGGAVTVQIPDTGAVLTGTARPDGSVEVRS
ncbi:MAG: hypothetical protein JST30_03615 [Armatimonadetes bacterium]|nr:hypothetical protein [Armatimonadota bacterium]